MNPGSSLLSRSGGWLSLATLLVAGALAPASANAMSLPAEGADLSARLAELAMPAVRSAPRAEQAARLSLAARGPGSLLRDGNRVLVDVRFDGDAVPLLEALHALGAEVVHASDRYETVTVAARPSELRQIGALAGVESVTEVLTPIVSGVDCGGAVRSEGDIQVKADSARAGFGIDGSGVTVGILSDSFDRDGTDTTNASDDVASGDLPGPGSPCGSSVPVAVLDDSEAEGFDEGRAMAQIVHDLAPGASLSFATAFSGETAFAANIRDLAAAGADVIVDDVIYFDEPFFQDGPIAVAVDDVTAAGVSYFSAAGNNNLIDKGGRNIASWEAPAFRSAAACPAALLVVSGFGSAPCMDFDPGAGSDATFGITVSEGATLTVDLQWAEPWNGVTTDLNVLLLDAAGKALKVKEGPQEFLVGSADDNVKGQRPVEVFQWENETGSDAKVQMAISNCSGALCNEDAAGASPRLKFALLQNGGGVTETEYPQSSGGDTVGPTVFGHAAAAGAMALAAVPHSNSSAVEPYSSRGPVKHYFGPVLDASPAPSTGEQTIAKPDLAATDCGVTTFFSFQDGLGAWRFCGTSAAAPHAAAVAALMRQGNPTAGPPQVRSALVATAKPVGAFGADAAGAGLVDAPAAVAALGVVPVTKSVSSATETPAGPAPTEGAVAPAGDRTAPGTTIVAHPPKLIFTIRRTVRGRFRFGSDEADVSFACRVDKGPFARCGAAISRRFRIGRHLVQVRAIDRAGNVDATPAVFRFRVKRIG